MIKPEIYMHQFDSKITICKEFGIPEDSLDDCHVYLAYYHVGDYGCDSSAFVLYEDSLGNLFEVNGGHCSCHGLSEKDYSTGESSQWEPEHVTVDALLHRSTKGSLGSVGGYDDYGYEKESKTIIEFLIKNEHN